MLRISKLTDYAIVILVHICQQPDKFFQASTIARHTTIAKPTVSKLLKQLTKQQILSSQRGVTGGYKIAVNPDKISIAKIITALEGPLAITECSLSNTHCSIAAKCTISPIWLQINTVIYNTLQQHSLSDLMHPGTSSISITCKSVTKHAGGVR